MTVEGLALDLDVVIRIKKAKKVVINCKGVERRDAFEEWEVRNLKYKVLLHEVVAKGHKLWIDVGYLAGAPSGRLGQKVEGLVVETDPTGDVEITSKTEVVLLYKKLDA